MEEGEESEEVDEGGGVSERRAADRLLASSSSSSSEGSSQADAVAQWSCEQVARWITLVGFGEYAQRIAIEHKVDGAALLMLTEEDLRRKPLKLQALGDVKKLACAIRALQRRSTAPLDLAISPQQSHANAFNNGSNGVHMKRVAQFHSSKSQAELLVERVESPDTPEKSLWKAVIAAAYCLVALLITAFVMVVVDDRVPDMKTYPPLPDIVLDNLPLIPWAFEMCEVLAISLGIIWLIVVALHKHRLIILRRAFALTGTVFLLRCVTMLITSLSVPGVHLQCRTNTSGDLTAKFRAAFTIWYNMGLSVKGVRSCGDYMFSGHTSAITLFNHFITEYTPSNWHHLHTLTWVVNLFGVFFILAGHEHYSIDVFIAFYISSRLFLYYHAVAYNSNSVTTTDHRTRWWFPMAWFFESGGHGRMKNEYELPLPRASTLKAIAGRAKDWLLSSRQKHL